MKRQLAVLFFLTTGLAVCQFDYAIQGLVTDASGSVVPNAAIHVVNVDTGIARDVRTAQDGLYRVLSLGPGNYQARAEASGFRTLTRNGIQLGLTDTARVDFALEVGDMSQSVSVATQASDVQTEQVSFSNTISQREISEVPMNGNNVLELLALQPGVTGRAFRYGGGVDSNAPFGSHPTVSINANGARTDSNSFTVDGASVNGVADGGTVVIQPNPDSVQELRVNLNTYSAEYGRNSGAQVEIITKGGTNQFHGGAFDQFTNNTLSSRVEFEAHTPIFRRNQFGYNLGGPIFRNRLFFFTSYDGLQGTGGRGAVATVETPQFTDYVKTAFPDSLAAKLLTEFQPVAYPSYNFKSLGSVVVGSPSAIGPPNSLLDVGSVNYVPATIRRGNQFSGRIDYDLRPGKDRLFVNYFNMHSTQLSGGPRPAFDRPEDDFDELVNLNATHIFGPNKINEFKFGLNRTASGSVFPKNLQVPTINVAGITGFGLQGQFPAGWYQTEFSYKDMFSWNHSSHSFKMGAEWRRIRSNSHQTTTYVPSYSFNSILNFGDDQPASETQLVDPRTGIPATNVLGMRTGELGAFLNDDWKFRPNLTVSFGLRYERFGTWTEVNNQLRNMVLGPGDTFTQQLSNASLQFVPKLWSTPNLNFMPRLGFAWNPDGKGGTAIRGGYGIYYDHIFGTPLLNVRSNPPSRALAVSGYQYGTQVYYALGNPSAPNLGFPIDPQWQLGLDSHNGILGSRVALLEIVDPHLQQPYSQNWYFGIQQAVGWRVVVEANYMGSVGHHLLNTIDLNRFSGDLLQNGAFHGYNQSFAAMPLTESTSNSAYNGGAIQVKRPFAHGFSLQSAFTFGKTIDDNDSFGGITAYVDATNRKLNRGLAGFDVPRRLTNAVVWAVPFFSSQKGILRKLLGGWTLSGTGIFDAGSPLTVTSSAAYPRGDWNADGTSNDRPNAPAGNVARSGYERSAFLTGIIPISVFPIPALGTIGNLGRNTFRGPGFAQVDAALSKTFAVTERVNLQLRLNGYNMLNRVNLDNPVMDLNNNNFGRSTTQQTPRALEIALRLRF
jgi:hypothetical protein